MTRRRSPIRLPQHPWHVHRLATGERALGRAPALGRPCMGPPPRRLSGFRGEDGQL